LNASVERMPCCVLRVACRSLASRITHHASRITHHVPRFTTAFLSFFAALACTLSLRAAGPGDEVIIVYNRQVPESKNVAEHYADRRQVPASQIFGFDLTTNEAMSRGEFRDSLQKPLAAALESKKLWHVGSRIIHATAKQPGRVDWMVIQSRIRYAVLCYGVPLKILADPSLNEKATENLRPELRRNEAAVDNELALLPMLEEHLPLGGPLPNPLFGTTNEAALDPTNGLLLVTRLDGPDAGIARSLVDKAIESETNGLWGRAYFDLRNITDPLFKPGDDWIRQASEVARHLGFETVVDENPGTFPTAFPMSQIAFYAGWYAQDVCGPFALPYVEFMPGAFAYHLHSYSAATLRSTDHCWAGPLLAKGATCTMGSVDEPYLTGTPDVGVFAARFMMNGFTFGEAAYDGIGTLSWQTTVVGDPLYRPFGQNPQKLMADLEQRHSKWLDWAYLRLFNLNLLNGRPLADCVAMLEQVKPLKQSAVLTEKLGDWYEAQGKPSSAAQAYGDALKLDASPEQRIRLRLTLGERLVALGRDAEAYDDYQQLLEHRPEYPDKTGLYTKLLTLAQKLNKKADAEKYEAELNHLK
jgi:uncharacterized protein (TIGR03790 family)